MAKAQRKKSTRRSRRSTGSFGRTHKYGATPTHVDGIRFASKMEAGHYKRLRLLEDDGRITNLELQPEYELHVATRPNQKLTRIGKYVADFRYWDIEEGCTIVVDVKGFKTPIYRWKKKHVEAEYGITITEVTFK